MRTNKLSVTHLNTVKQWDRMPWSEAEPQTVNPTKEQMLRSSLALLVNESDNEEACRKVMEKALDAGLFDIAKEALHTFAQGSNFHMVVSVSTLFEEMRYWRYIDRDLLTYCEKRVLAANPKECRSGIGFGGHFTEQRSRALGMLGRYVFFMGDPDRALQLWNEASDARDRDEVIAQMCLEIVKNAPNHFDVALQLAECILTKTVKAEALASMSDYA